MANICTNYITIQGHPDIIELIAKDYIGYDEKEDIVNFNFGLMAPIPEELLGDDYAWRINNWGNKWDGSDCYVDLDESSIYLTIDTAWSPCDRWIYKLIELCPGVDVYHEYYEPGDGYIGWIQHYENEGPDEYEETCYSFTDQSYEYWLTVFEKEYENFDWLDEHVSEMEDDEDITEAEANEVRRMIEDDSSLELLIARCIELDIL